MTSGSGPGARGRLTARIPSGAALLGGLGLAVALAGPAAAGDTVIVVDTNTDTVSVDGFCSLPEAVAASNSDTSFNECDGSTGDPTTITFDASLDNSTITLGATLTVTDGVEIAGPGADLLTISGGDSVRVFDFASAGAESYVLSGLTIADGSVSGDNGAGIRMADADDTLTVNDASIEGNAVTGTGGGFAISNGGTLNVNRSTLTGNDASSSGSALSVVNSTATFENVTVSGNTTSSAVISAIAVAGGTSNVTLLFSTVASNDGLGLSNLAITGSTANASVGGSIFADNGSNNFANTSGGGIANLTSLGGNVSDDTSGGLLESSDQESTDPLLVALADNGGTTLTHAITDASPAADAATEPSCPATDQIGTARPAGSACDSGAFEFFDADIFADGFESGDVSVWTTSVP